MLQFEWDEAKNKLNIKRHGIAFEDVTGFLDDPGVFERLDLRENYGEDRIIAFAMVEGQVMAIVYVERGATLRIISARLATRQETNDYFKRNV